MNERILRLEVHIWTSGVTLLVGIISYWPNRDKRDTIRKTWMKMGHDLPRQ